MSLPLSKSKFYSFYLWLIIIAVLFIVLYFLLPFDNYPVEERLRLAEKKALAWQLIDAEKILEPAAEDNKSDLKFVNAYVEVLLKEGKIKKAKSYIQGIKNYKKINDPRFLLNTSQIYYFIGLPDSAAIFANNAVFYSRKNNNDKVESKANNIIGLINFYLARYDSALIYQYKALALSKNSGIKNVQADALRQIGVIYWYKGKLDSALNSFYLPALSLYRKVNDKIGEAITLNDIGLIYFDKKDWFKEYPYHLQAYKIQKKVNDLLGLADTYYFLAHVPIFNKRMLNYEYEYITKSYNLSLSIGYKWGNIVARNRLILFVLQHSSLYPSTQIKKSSKEDNTGEGQIISTVLGLYAADKGKNFENIISVNKKLFSLSDSLGYEVYKFWSLLNLSSALFETGKINEAKSYLLKAKELTYTKKGRKYNPINIDLLLSRIYKKQNEINKSINILKAKAAVYDSIYSVNINKPQSVYNYESAVVSVYWKRSLIYSLLLDNLFDAGRTEEFFKYSELQRLLPFWGKYQNEENTEGLSFSNLLMDFQKSDAEGKNLWPPIINKLEKLISLHSHGNKNVNYFYGGHSALSTISTADVQKKLKLKDLFVEYAFGEENLYAVVINKSKIKLLKLFVNKENITKLINHFIKTLKRGKDNPDDKLWMGPAKNLFNKLIKPVIDDGLLKAGSNLIISPHGSIHLLPFNALLNTVVSYKEKFLVEDYNISFVTSAKSISGKSGTKLKKYLGVAPGNNGLVYADKEIKEIPDSLFITKKLLTGKNATKSKFLEIAAEYDIIHIASHTKINSQNPLYSSIEFADKPLKIYEIFKTGFKPVLLILSSCKTGNAVGMVNDIPTEIDLINFTRAFLERGVKNVIATKWLLEDESAYLIMRYFFKYLKQEKEYPRFDEILTTAQRKYLKDAKTKGFKTHPYYWAPFYINL